MRTRPESTFAPDSHGGERVVAFFVATEVAREFRNAARTDRSQRAAHVGATRIELLEARGVARAGATGDRGERRVVVRFLRGGDVDSRHEPVWRDDVRDPDGFPARHDNIPGAR